MQKQTTPEVPQGLAPALNSFLRWVRDQIKGNAVAKVQESAGKASIGANKAQKAASNAADNANSAQSIANSALENATSAIMTANDATETATSAQGRADSAYSLASTAKKTAERADQRSTTAQQIAEDAIIIASNGGRGRVRFDIDQDLTVEQMARARANINAAQDVMATTSTGGQVIIGDGLVVDSSGTVSLSPATSSSLGGVIIGAGISVASDGTISVSGGGGSGGGYVLPAATTSSLGGVIVGSGLGVTGGGTLSVNASYATSANVSAIISSGGYATSSYVNSAVSGKITSAQALQAVASGGYVTSSYVSSSVSDKITSAQAVEAVSSAGYVTSTYVAGATVASAGNATTVNGLTVSAAVPADAVFTDTTYSSGTSQLLSSGTNTTQRTWTPKILHDYISGASVASAASAGTATNASSLGGTAASSYALITDLPSDYVGATVSSAGVHGLVPAATSSDKDKYLKGDGTWSAPSFALTPATSSAIGGVMVGSGIDVTAAGIISVDGNAIDSIVSSGGYVTSSYVSSATVASAGEAMTAASCTGNAATATSATNAGTATKIGTATVGGTTQPVYVSSGTIVSCTYSLGKSVPADAKFTDTVFDDSGVVHISGTETISGTKTFSTRVKFADGGLAIQRDVDNGELIIIGGTDVSSATQGAKIGLRGGQYNVVSGYEGSFFIQSRNSTGSNSVSLVGKHDGTLTWNNKGFVYDSGAQTISGNKTFSDTAFLGSGAYLRKADSTDFIQLSFSTVLNGARLNLFGKDYSDNSSKGEFALGTGNGTAAKYFVGKPDGTLSWDNKYFVYTTTDQTISGVKTFESNIVASSTIGMRRNVDNSFIHIYGGTANGKGALISLEGKDATNQGSFTVRAHNGTTNKDLIGKANGTLTWNGQTIQTTSDERLKTPISCVPDTVLDAWGAVGWGQFQFLDAVEEKGSDKARLHLGLIAQRTKAVFEAHGLDACEYGILCHEERPASEDEEAVDLWMVRYTEALAMEAAYQRRRADRAELRIAALEQRFDELEAVLAVLGTQEDMK